MNTVKGLFEADDEGIVHLRLPTGNPGRHIEVLVVWEDSEQGADSANEDWGDLFGLLRDIPLEPPAQEGR